MTGDTCRCGQRGAGSHGRSPHSDRAADGVALPRGCRFIAWRDVEEAICQVLRVGLRVLSGSCVLARRSWADHGDNHEQRLCNVPRFLGRPLSRMQAWTIGRAASEHAGVQVLALRPSQHGERNEPAPITHICSDTHACVRSCARPRTSALPSARLAGRASRPST
jgi:hypothetical protein